MTANQLRELKDNLAAMFAANTATDELNEWADAYSVNRSDLLGLLRMFYDADKW